MRSIIGLGSMACSASSRNVDCPGTNPVLRGWRQVRDARQSLEPLDNRFLELMRDGVDILGTKFENFGTPGAK